MQFQTNTVFNRGEKKKKKRKERKKHVPNFFLQDCKCSETKAAEEYWAKTQEVGQSYTLPFWKGATHFGKCLCICYIRVYKNGISVRYNSSESSI
jgi:hypothetical protein